MKTMTTTNVASQRVAGARGRDGLGTALDYASTRSITSAHSIAWTHMADWTGAHKPFPRHLKEPPQ